MKLLIRNIGEALLCNDSLTQPVRGGEMKNPHSIQDAYIALNTGKIEDYGKMSNCPDDSKFDQVINAKNRLVIPAWVDSHTHLVYHDSREEEFVMRIEGRSYEEIAASGGGILNSAQRLSNASEDELFDQASARLKEVIGFGTGAIEIKSGYGLSYESELKILRVVKRLKSVSPIPIKATFLGAHAIPQEFIDNRQGYIDLIVDRMLPDIVSEGLADFIDVFCDKGFFTTDETKYILEAGKKYGLRGKIHANELANSGGVQIGVEMDALSVDHLERIGDEEIECLLNSKTLPVGLPSTSFFLNLPYAPTRKMIDAGLPVVLASDYNPGSTPSGNIPFLLSLACLKMKLLPIEAITAITINGACALEMESNLGSISRGKLANLIITKPMKSVAFMPYAFGSRHVDQMIINGRVWKGQLTV